MSGHTFVGSPSLLRIGDTIVTEKRRTLVKKLAICPAKHKGVGGRHVNDTDCYDNVSDILIYRPGRATEENTEGE